MQQLTITMHAKALNLDFNMKKNILLNIGLVIGGILLFSSFKKKGTLKGSVLVGQGNAPTGTYQVYSNVGTVVYDDMMNVIYTYDQAGLGMTCTGQKGSAMYNVVIGDSFQNGQAGLVFINDVQTL